MLARSAQIRTPPLLGAHTPLPHLKPIPLSRALIIYLKEECQLELTKRMEKQVDTFRKNLRAKLPSHELGVSSWATASSIANSNNIHNVLGKTGATVHSAGVIGSAALLTLGPTRPIPYPYPLNQRVPLSPCLALFQAPFLM